MKGKTSIFKIHLHMERLYSQLFVTIFVQPFLLWIINYLTLFIQVIYVMILHLQKDMFPLRVFDEVTKAHMIFSHFLIIMH